MANRVAQLMDEIQAEVASLPDPWVRALAPLLRDARAELIDNVATWLAHVDEPLAAFDRMRYRSALAQLDRALSVVRDRLPGEVGSLVKRQGKVAATLSVDHLERELRIFGGEARALPFKPAALIARGDHILLPRFERSVATYGEEGISAIRRELALGMMRGESFREMAGRIASRVFPKIGRGLVDGSVPLADGAVAVGRGLWVATGSDYRAVRIVRTEGINAYNAVVVEGIRELNRDDPGYRKKWDSANDWRVCVACMGLDGEVVDEDADFSEGVAHSPLHPHCRCGVVAWRDEWARDYEQDRRERRAA